MSPTVRSISLFACVLTLGVACAPRIAEVSPSEIPELRERVAREPRNAQATLRLGAALFAADRCDEAVPVARSGIELDPRNAVGPLVVGQCLEAGERFDEAIELYRWFSDANPNARGVGAVRAREMFAIRNAATAGARRALAREAELTAEAADLRTVAVLPLSVVGDEQYRPLSRALAQMLISDLGLLREFRLVERLQLSALLDELALAETDRVDQETAARMGRLVQAGRMVQGLAAIPPDGQVRLEASVLDAQGQVTAPAIATGRFRDLMRLQKDLVVVLAGRLGYTLSEAERRMILENGTQNLVAFLAYANGIEAEDRGDYGNAAAFYAQAVRADPNFQAARNQHQATVAAPAAQQATASQVTTVAAEPPPPPPATESSLGAVATTITDLAPTQSEAVAAQTVESAPTVISGPTADPPPTTTTTPQLTGTIRIIFRLP